MVYHPNQFIVDTFKYWDFSEAITPDPRSNQVTLRLQYRVEIVKSVWVWRYIITMGVQAVVNYNAKTAYDLYPKLVQEYLESM